MQELIAELLAQHFSALNFVTRAAGCVSRMEKPRKDKQPLSFPVAPHVYVAEGETATICDNSEDYYDVSPATKEAGILFFEDLGARVVASNRRYDTWEGKLKLVYWSNAKLTGRTLPELSAAILNNLPGELSATSSFYGASLRFTKQYPKYPTPFDSYRYDEDQTKYLSAPYGCFAFDVTYTARAARGCALNIVLNPQVC